MWKSAIFHSIAIIWCGSGSWWKILKFYLILKCLVKMVPLSLFIVAIRTSEFVGKIRSWSGLLRNCYCRVTFTITLSEVNIFTYCISSIPHIRPASIIFLYSLQMLVLLENTSLVLHKIVRIAGIIIVAVIIWGRALYEEIR